MTVMDTSLPTKETIEGSSLASLVWILFGSPGIGKSSFFAKAVIGNKKPLFLCMDSGLRFIKCLKKPIIQWRQFNALVDDFVRDPSKTKPYSMVILDPIDLFFQSCRAEVCKRKNIEHISELEFGKGYDLVKDAFGLPIARLCSLGVERGFGVAFISHAKDIEIRGRTVRTSKVVPSIQKQGYSVIAPLADIIGYAGFSADKADKVDGEMGRVLLVEPSETIEGKDRTGMLPAKCPLDFDAVKEAFEGKGAEEVVEESAEVAEVVEE